MKVLVSDEIADEVNVDQFYEDKGGHDGIIVSLKLGSLDVGGVVTKMKILHKSDSVVTDRLSISFVCDSDAASSFILSSHIDTISLSSAKQKLVIQEYNNFSILSKYFKLLRNRKHQCCIIVELSNR